jgi:pSer/pThr/pTyr-binding forkhead associated (FHA) protein
MARATLRVAGGPGSGRSFDVSDALEIGRGLPDSPELSDPTISRRHARLSFDSAGQLTIEDLGSRNGTLVNGRLITDVDSLAVGDVIDLGDTTLEVSEIEPTFVSVTAAEVQVTRVKPAQAGGPAADEAASGTAERRKTRSRSIAAGLPVLSARTLINGVRIRGAVVVLAVVVALWLAFYVQLKNGDDPGLKKAAAIVQPATTTTETTSTSAPVTSTTTQATTSTSSTTATTTTKSS